MAYVHGAASKAPPGIFNFAARYTSDQINAHKSGGGASHHPALSSPVNGRPNGSNVPVSAARRYGFAVVGSTEDSHLNSKRRNGRHRSRPLGRSRPHLSSHNKQYRDNDDDFDEDEMTADSVVAEVRSRRNEQRYATTNQQQQQQQTSQVPNSMPQPPPVVPGGVKKKGKDITIYRFKPQNFPTGYTISLYGGSGSGKTTTLFNFVSLMRYRFDALIVFSFTDITLDMYKDVTLHYFVFNGFYPEVMVRVLEYFQRCHEQHLPTPTVGFVLDDLFMEKGVPGDPVWKTFYRRCRHYGIQLFEGKHAFSDTAKSNKDSAHCVGIVGADNPILNEDAWKERLFGNMFDCKDDFLAALQKATGGRKAAALMLDKSAGAPRLCYFHAKDKTEMIPFSVGHPDIYAAIYMWGINTIPNHIVTQNPRAKRPRDIPAYQKALGLYNGDDENGAQNGTSSGGNHAVEIPLAQQTDYLAKMQKAGKKPDPAVLAGFGKMVLLDD